MRILMSAIGSRGDVQPLLAVALQLRERGHDILFTAPPDYAGLVERFGLRFIPVGVNLQAALKDVYKDAHKLSVVMDFCRSMVADQFTVLGALDEPFDMVVGGGLQCAAQSLAEARGLPYVYIAYCPSMLRSSYHAPVFFAPQRLPRWMNRLLWWGYLRMGNTAMRDPINQGRRRLGLDAMQDLYRYVFESDHLLLAVHQALAPRPDDVAPQTEVTGFVFLDDTQELPADVTAFIDAGSPPVYLGFGSVPIDDPAKLAAVIRETVERSQLRYIVSASDLDANVLGNSCLLVGALNHAALFPRLAAVVHHASAGTTSTAARASAPQVAVPHAADQHYWAHRIQVAGVGPAPLPFRKLSARRLAQRVLRSVSDVKLQQRASALGEVLRSDDGAARAADRIESVAAEHSARSQV